MRIVPTVALAVLLCNIPMVAHAQDDDAEVTRMAREHYKAGLDAYKAGQFDVAIKELKRAYLLKRLAPLLLNIGATYRKMGDHELALHFYKKYLEEAPADAKDRGDVEKTIAEIEQEKASGSTPAPAPTPAPTPEKGEPAHEVKEPEPARTPQEFSHTVIDAAPPDQPIDVRVSMPVMKGVKVYVYYRQPGESDFRPVLMKRHGPEKIGRIPGDAVSGKALQYYIEARDPNGAVVKSSGSQSNPNIVMVDPSAPSQMVASLEERRERESEAAPEESAATKHRRNMDDESAPIVSSETARKAPRDTGPPAKFGPLFWAGLAVGAVGVAMFATGAAMGALAQQQADLVGQDSRATNPPLEFNPMQGDSDRPIESKGQSYNLAAEILMPIGGVLAAGGIVMIIIERVVLHGPKRSEKPKHRAPRNEEAAHTPWYIAPSAGPNLVGVGGGFSF